MQDLLSCKDYIAESKKWEVKRKNMAYAQLINRARMGLQVAISESKEASAAMVHKVNLAHDLDTKKGKHVVEIYLYSKQLAGEPHGL